MNDHEHSDFKFWFGFFIGGLLGAITLFFIGTKEGKKVRGKIQRAGSDLLENLDERLEDLKDRGQKLMAETQDFKDGIADVISEKKDQLAGDVFDKIDTTLSKIENIQKQGQESVADIRRKLQKSAPKKSS